jgi:FHS family glucose/mannose:H+ symporter-like MFS transporter
VTDGFGKPSAGLHAGFLISGVVTVVLGPLIPEATARWGVPPSRVGLLFFAQFLASSAGAIVASRRPRRSVVLGYASISAGLLGVALGSFAAALVAMGLVGLGLGLSIPATNVIVAQRHPEGRGAALSRLNLVWGIGAVLSPLLFMPLPPRIRVEGVLLPLATFSALAALGLFSLLPADAPRPARVADDRTGTATAGPLALAAGQLCLVCGTEAALGGWMVAAYPTDGPLPPLLVGGGFWAAFLAGRALAPALLRRWSESALHAATLAVAGAGVAIVLFAGSGTAIALGGLLAGLGMAPVFPLVVSSLTALIERSRSRHAGAVFAVGGLGGACLPWLAGRLGETMGSLRFGFAVPLGAIVVMALLLGLHRLVSAGHAAAPAMPLRRTQGA